MLALTRYLTRGWSRRPAPRTTCGTGSGRIASRRSFSRWTGRSAVDREALVRSVGDVLLLPGGQTVQQRAAVEPRLPHRVGEDAVRVRLPRQVLPALVHVRGAAGRRLVALLAGEVLRLVASGLRR